MKRIVLAYMIVLGSFIIIPGPSSAQCSICTKTAQQLGEKPARGLNSGIIYLALAPYAITLYIVYRWRKSR